MTAKEVIDALTYYNTWRRGAEIEMPEPKNVGQAIDAAINIIESLLSASIDTLTSNLHLCDGDICTLKTLKDAVENIEKNWMGDKYGH
jgi:hypothetical protein